MSKRFDLPMTGGVYVRAVFSGWGYAVAVDLLAAALRVVNRCSVRWRVAADFAGYLASPESLQVVWRDRGTGRVEIIGGDCFTGRELWGGLRAEFNDLRYVGALDAPAWLPGGAVWRCEYGDGEVCAAVALVRRGGLFDKKEPAFSERRGLYEMGFDNYCATSEGQVWGLGLHGHDGLVGALDAPDFIAVGSCLSCSDGGAGIGSVVGRAK